MDTNDVLALLDKYPDRQSTSHTKSVIENLGSSPGLEHKMEMEFARRVKANRNGHTEDIVRGK